MHLLVGVGVLFALLFKNEMSLNEYMQELKECINDLYALEQ